MSTKFSSQRIRSRSKRLSNRQTTWGGKQRNRLPVPALRALEGEFATITKRSRSRSRSRSRTSLNVKGLTLEKQTFLHSKTFKVLLLVAFGMGVGTAVYRNGACRKYIAEEIVAKFRLSENLTNPFTRMKELASKTYEQVKDIATGRVTKEYRQASVQYQNASAQYQNALAAYEKRESVLEKTLDAARSREEFAVPGPRPYTNSDWLDAETAFSDYQDVLREEFNAHNDEVLKQEWSLLKPVLEKYKRLPPVFRNGLLDLDVKNNENAASRHQYLIDGLHANVAKYNAYRRENDQQQDQLYRSVQNGISGPLQRMPWGELIS